MEGIVTVLTLVGGLLYVVRQLCAIDLQVLTRRVRERTRLLEQERAMHDLLEAMEADAIARDLDFYDLHMLMEIVDPFNEGRDSLQRRREEQAVAVADALARREGTGVRWPGNRGGRLRTNLPRWALALLPPDEADRCAREWASHLHGLLTANELPQVRIDRRRYVRYVVILACKRRVRRVHRRSRTRR